MRPFFLAIALVVGAPLATAQAGDVTYTVTRQARTSPPAPGGLVASAPSSTQRRLTFDGSIGRTELVAPDLPDTIDGRRIIHMAEMKGPIHYVDGETGEWVRQLDLLGRPFRIEETQPAFAWRLTGEEGEYEGYEVQKAVATIDSSEVEAWFTTEIPVSLGPDQYGGLPGLILVLRTGSAMYEATSIVVANGEGSDHVRPERPSEGSVVTAEEYAATLRARMEALQNHRGAGGMIVVPVN